MPRTSLQPLEYLGLDTPTVQVYAACVSLGQSKASEIAKKSKLTRTSVYRCLERLQQEGLIHQEIREGKNYYRAADPQMIPQLMERQAKEVQALLPVLVDLFKSVSRSMPSFRFYSEASGIKTVLEEVLRTTSKTYDIFGSIYDEEFIYSVTEKYLADWMERRIRAGIFHRSLRPQVSKHKEAQIKNPLFGASGKKQLREIRFAPAQIELPVLVYLFDDKVAFINPKLGQQFAAVLESKEMFQSLKSIFQYLWEISDSAA